ncbi:Protein N-acetyltransferase, RimJ/RimL family [Virgibacillus subterraneus]|uniref:Protein N-acetyltransferase, RimJ/RimL family n=2 Tax=Virgibacillus TaxID=84406 RepID=A0A1H1EZ34_9BACI|nr:MULTISPECIES: GNAT family protein [Virgibacillus]SDQ93794.1 Protein N-acetyltransferase, RimJ/RimL family [Virgibacillus salinus]SEQ94768.1 Protein N-acetyltransferase, RimJ/RimL family [Virgibacillus subterraneus]
MLSSKRLQFRKMMEIDIEKYHSWRNDLDVMKTTSTSLDLYSLDETRSFVENIILNSISSKSYIIEERESDTAIGVTSLINIDTKNRNAECIIDIGEKEYWGKGYGTEALQMLLEYAFLELNLHRVSLRVFSLNERAIHIYNKLGFEKEGVMRESLYRNGKWHDIITMGILKREYMSKQ